MIKTSRVAVGVSCKSTFGKLGLQWTSISPKFNTTAEVRTGLPVISVAGKAIGTWPAKTSFVRTTKANGSGEILSTGIILLASAVVAIAMPHWSGPHWARSMILTFPLSHWKCLGSMKTFFRGSSEEEAGLSFPLGRVCLCWSVPSDAFFLCSFWCSLSSTFVIILILALLACTLSSSQAARSSFERMVVSWLASIVPTSNAALAANASCGTPLCPKMVCNFLALASLTFDVDFTPPGSAHARNSTVASRFSWWMCNRGSMPFPFCMAMIVMELMTSERSRAVTCKRVSLPGMARKQARWSNGPLTQMAIVSSWPT